MFLLSIDLGVIYLDDNLAGVECYLPAQEPRRFQHNRYNKLHLAILNDVVHTYRKHAGRKERGVHAGISRRPTNVLRAARAWVLNDNDEWPFSFVNCCKAVDVDFMQVRRGLEGMLADYARTKCNQQASGES